MKNKENRKDTGEKDNKGRPLYHWHNDNNKIAQKFLGNLTEVNNDFSHDHNPLLKEAPPEKELTEDFCYEISEWLVNNLDREDIIFGTIHGSYLYGTAHENSDVDLFAVVENGKNKNKVVNGQDVQIMNLKTFTRLVDTGAHQAIEALYSPYKVYNEETHYQSFIESMRPSPYQFVKKCRSAGAAFKEKGEKENNKKQLRHAVRLEESGQAMMNGTYSPVWKPIGEYDLNDF